MKCKLCSILSEHKDSVVLHKFFWWHFRIAGSVEIHCPCKSSLIHITCAMSVCPHLKASYLLDIFTACFTLHHHPNCLPWRDPNTFLFPYSSAMFRCPDESSLHCHQLPVPSCVCRLGLVFSVTHQTHIFSSVFTYSQSCF